jgi:hypothetical protein
MRRKRNGCKAQLAKMALNIAVNNIIENNGVIESEMA